jgi:LuxR family maltose regulon positive regulatory protein
VQAAETDQAARERRPVDNFFESKLQPPPVRTALVSRAPLIDRLASAEDVPITAVVAPAGYGKTTLLAEWAHRDPSRVAWLSLDLHDNDLAVLLPYTAAALDRLEPIDPALLRPSAGNRSVTAVAAGLAGAMSGMRRPVMLIFDHVELLENEECRDALGELALHLPEGSRLAFASRAEPPVPMPRLRAQGDVVEVGVDDLAMVFSEARALLERAGVDVTDAEVERLLERTEGWPVGLYLAALAVKAGGSVQDAGIAFSGDDTLVADYLRSEILGHLSADELEFLTRTAVLERMSASLCDATLETTGSATMLESLAKSNLLLVALDRQGAWYRYHHLFRDLLLVELERREPGLASSLHERAARWCDANQLAALAIDHAQAAGDDDMANRLILTNAVSAYSNGQHASVRRWLSWVENQGLLPQYPGVAVMGALFFSAAGPQADAERWALAAEYPAADLALEDGRTLAARIAPDRRLPDGSTLESWWAVFRMVLGRGGFTGARRDVQLALDGLAPQSEFRAMALATDGICELLGGDAVAAEEKFLDAADLAAATGFAPVQLVSYGERGCIACASLDWDGADTITREALAIIDGRELEDYHSAALVYAVAARVAQHQGDDRTRDTHLTRAVRLRPQLTSVRPFTSMQTLLQMARVYESLGDVAGAREVLRQAQEIVRRQPDLGNLSDELSELTAKLDTKATGVVGATALTAAELRLVPYLPTHLTFPQIASRLHVSRNTVKTHSISVYQKLGVSSRADAVQRLEELGLLDA